MKTFQTGLSNWIISEKDLYWDFKCKECGKSRHFSKLLSYSSIEVTEKDCPFCGAIMHKENLSTNC